MTPSTIIDSFRHVLSVALLIQASIFEPPMADWISPIGTGGAFLCSAVLPSSAAAAAAAAAASWSRSDVAKYRHVAENVLSRFGIGGGAAAVEMVPAARSGVRVVALAALHHH